MDHLTFDAPTHTYRWRGVIVPSVTECLCEVGLSEWGDEDAPRHRTTAALDARERGTLVHAWAAEWDRTGTNTPLPAECHGYAEAYAAALADLTPEHLVIEQPLYDPSARVCGTPDRLWRVVPPGATAPRLAVVDLKTGGREDWHQHQLAGYRRLILANAGRWPDLALPQPLDAYDLYLGADGRYRLHRQLDASAEWLAIVTVAHLLRRLRRRTAHAATQEDVRDPRD